MARFDGPEGLCWPSFSLYLPGHFVGALKVKSSTCTIVVLTGHSFIHYSRMMLMAYIYTGRTIIVLWSCPKSMDLFTVTLKDSQGLTRVCLTRGISRDAELVFQLITMVLLTIIIYGIDPLQAFSCWLLNSSCSVLWLLKVINISSTFLACNL